MGVRSVVTLRIGGRRVIHHTPCFALGVIYDVYVDRAAFASADAEV